MEEDKELKIKQSGPYGVSSPFLSQLGQPFGTFERIRGLVDSRQKLNVSLESTFPAVWSNTQIADFVISNTDTRNFISNELQHTTLNKDQEYSVITHHVGEIPSSHFTASDLLEKTDERRRVIGFARQTGKTHFNHLVHNFPVSSTATERAIPVNLKALISLADKNSTSNEAAEFGLENMSGEIKAQLQEMVADERKAVVKQAAGEILNVLRAAKACEDRHIVAIRTARASITQYKKQLDQINRAKAYAKETDNYIPLAESVWVTSSEMNGVAKELREIPEGWVAPETPAIEPPVVD